MVSSPMLAPKLTPETTTSGVKSSSPVTAIWTQSVGVPLTKKKPLGALRTTSGRSSVSELEAPERSRSGATTVTSPSRSSAQASAAMPGAKYPSSLETRIFTRTILQSDRFEQARHTVSKVRALRAHGAPFRRRAGDGQARLSRRDRRAARAEGGAREGTQHRALAWRSGDGRRAAQAPGG